MANVKLEVADQTFRAQIRTRRGDSDDGMTGKRKMFSQTRGKDWEVFYANAMTR